MDRTKILREILAEIKRSETLTKFFVEQRERLEDGWTDDIEQLVIELLLSRAEAKMNRKFGRSDAYQYMLEGIGLDVFALDNERRGPMRK